MRLLFHAETFEVFPCDGIVNQPAQKGQRFVGGEAFGQRERVMHSKADAVMFSQMDGHGLVFPLPRRSPAQINDDRKPGKWGLFADPAFEVLLVGWREDVWRN